MSKICIVGLGYIGLPTSIFLASKGYDVHGVDINKNVINSLRNNQIHIEEPGLSVIFEESIQNGNLHFSSQPVESDIFIIAVPTPITEEKKANLNYVKQAIHDVTPYLKPGNIVIVESTIPPRTIDDVVVPILKSHGLRPEDNEVYVTHCPERVIPGRILIELTENDRIVGGYTEEAAKKTAEFFRQVIKGEVFETSALTAEMSKLMENTFRDVNIALANELAKISESLGVNAHSVIDLANKHPRVNIHQPGPGVGGHCIPVDPYFIIEKVEELSPLMQTARMVNSSMPEFVVDKVKQLTDRHLKSKIAVLGLTYKGNVSDVRESSAIKIVNKLLKEGYKVNCHDPFANQEELDIELYSLENCLKEADLALILSDHTMYAGLSPALFSTMTEPIVFDTKNCMKPRDCFTLYQMGNLSTARKKHQI